MDHSLVLESKQQIQQFALEEVNVLQQTLVQTVQLDGLEQAVKTQSVLESLPIIQLFVCQEGLARLQTHVLALPDTLDPIVNMLPAQIFALMIHVSVTNKVNVLVQILVFATPNMLVQLVNMQFATELSEMKPLFAHLVVAVQLQILAHALMHSLVTNVNSSLAVV
jgi:hypothetical protein